MSWYDEPQTIRFVELRAGKHIRVHHVVVPALNGPGGYHKGRSIDGFRERVVRFNGTCADLGVTPWLHFYRIDEDSHEITVGAFGFDIYAKLPIVEHATVPEFFASIQYDSVKQTLEGRSIRTLGYGAAKSEAQRAARRLTVGQYRRQRRMALSADGRAS